MLEWGGGCKGLWWVKILRHMMPDLGQRSLLLHRHSDATEPPGQLDYGEFSLNGCAGSGERDQRQTS
jgi:hypothetical protein